MKTLYLDLSMGAAGDMLTAALLELFEDSEEKLKELNKLGVPHVRMSVEKLDKCGIIGSHIHVVIDGQEEAEGVEAPSHEHHHCSMEDIREIVNSLDVDAKIKKQVIEIYESIANAESRVHGKPVSEVHFHEVGMMDAIADVVNVCYLVDKLDVDEIVATPVNTGTGQVKCAHGILPVPAPATVQLLKGIPSFGRGDGERCTPTGAALIGALVDRFDSGHEMTIKAVGYGMGTRDFEQANCIRAMLGETDGNKANDEIVKLEFNVDDMTGEEIGFASEEIFAAGAVEVFNSPVFMKKNRPGQLFTVLVHEEYLDRVVKAIFKNTTTVGIRKNLCQRYILKREIKTIETDFGSINYKESEGYGIVRRKLEYEDIAQIARENNISLMDVKEELSQKMGDEDWKTI